jgi:recombination protein RecT
LALRTGLYKALNALPVHEGELVKWNPLTEDLVLDFEKKKSDAIIGYAGYFELINGFRKAVYWSKDQIEAHRKRFAKSDFGWKNDYDAMALKTVIRNMLSKWGILSIEMRTAYSQDLDTKLEYGEEPAVDDDNVIDVTAEIGASAETDQETHEENGSAASDVSNADQTLLGFGKDT